MVFLMVFRGGEAEKTRGILGEEVKFLRFRWKPKNTINLLDFISDRPIAKRQQIFDKQTFRYRMALLKLKVLATNGTKGKRTVWC